MSSTSTAPTYVIGVGMTKFLKSAGKSDYTELGFEAGVKAMLDAQINYDDVDTGVPAMFTAIRPADNAFFTSSE